MIIESFGTEKLKYLMIFWTEKLLLILVVTFVAHFVIYIINKFLSRLFNWTELDPTLEKFLHKSTITILWLITLGIILILLGVDVSAVVASFGVASFVVGFALKDTLANFAAGVMILLNKPFVVGDRIKVKGMEGRVKTVSMSYTQLISDNNDIVTLPNNVIWGREPIINYSSRNSSSPPH